MNIKIKIKIKLEYVTSVGYGGFGAITMFAIEVETEMNGPELISFINKGFVESKEGLPPFKPKDVREINEGVIQFTGSIPFSSQDDSLDYYREFVKKGWGVNNPEAKAIRGRGYKNFYPENFKQ